LPRIVTAGRIREQGAVYELSDQVKAGDRHFRINAAERKTAREEIMAERIMSRSHFRAVPMMGALLLATILPAAGCNALDFMPLVSATKTLSEDFQTGAAPKIIIATFNGAIDVSRGTDEQVVVDVTKSASGFDQAAAEANLDSVQVTMVQKGDTIEITAKKLGNQPGNFGAAVVIAVPRAAELDLRTSNGAVVCESIDGDIEIHSSNGKLEIVEGRGKLKLDTSNGTIKIDAKDATVNARTSNGRIEFAGSLAEGQHKFKTSNGRIEMVLPDDASFQFTGSTSNSRVRCDFPHTSRRSHRGRGHLEVTVGGEQEPKCQIVATSSNGSISLQPASKVENDNDDDN
jgi:DUF4097 and DUF4098 domain-containing protein YvlB